MTERLAEERQSFEQAAVDTVNAMLAQLRLPTLKQCLNDLGLSVTGGKTELTQRLSERLTTGVATNRP